jgi:PAS domain S-box-containing protein
MAGKDKKRTAIKISEAYQDLIEGAPDSIVAVDLKGNITYCNKATEILTGYGKEELMGKHFSRLGWMKKKDISHSLKLFKAIRSGKKVAPFETQVKHKDGKSYWIELHVSRIKTKGRVTGIQVNFIDITERKKMETALIRKERIATERARLLMDLRSLDRIDDILTRVCEAVHDSGLFERAVITLHDQLRQIVHLGQVGLSPNVVKRARQAPPIDHKLRSRITSKKFRISDSFFIPVEAGVDFTKSGRHIPQKKRSLDGGDWQPGDELFVPLRDFSAKTMGYLSVDTPTDGSRPDIKTIQSLETLVEAAAARVREVEARESLKRERDFSESIIGTANSLIVCLDADAKITVFNQECERATGYRREEVLGRRWPDLFLPPDQRHANLKSFAKWVRAHPRDQYEGPVVTRSGEIRTILWSNTAILGSGKKDVMAIAIGHDITKRKQAEEKLEKERHRLFSVLDILPAYVYVQAPDHSIHFVNRKFRELFGDPGKHPCYEVFHGRKEPCEECLTLRVLKTRIPQIYEWKSKDGRNYMVYEDTFPAPDGREMVVEFGIDITERKRAEKALQISQERYKLSTKAANVGVWDWDIKTNQFYIDPNVKEILGYKDEEIPNDIEVWTTYIHPHDLKPVMAAAQACIDGKTPEYVFEHRMMHKDGSVRWLLTRGNVIRDAKGNAVRMMGTDTDITERKWTEEALRRSEERFRLIAETSLDYIFQTDKSGKTIYCSPAIERVLGYTPKERQGTDFTRVILPSDLPKARALFKKVMQGETVQNLEINLLHKNGRTVSIEVSVVPIFENKKVTSLFGIARDITERKRAQEQLRESEQRYRSVVDNIGIGVSLISPNMEILSLNNQLKKWFPNIDVSKKPLCYRSFNDPPREGVCSYCPTYKTIKDGQVHESITETPAGDKITNYRIISSPIKDRAGKVIAAIEMVEDITESKRAEEALSESEEKFRTLAEQSPNMIFINKKGRVLYANEKCEEIMGYKREEFYSPDFDFLTLVAPEYRKLVKASLAKHIMGKEVTPYEYALITREGERIEAILSTKVISYRGENAILGIITDITERKRAEEALRESEEKYRTLVETAQEGIGITDPEENLTFVNQAFADMLGYKKEKLLGKNLSQISDEEEFAKFRKEAEKRKQGKSSKYETRLFTKKGKVKYFYVSAVPLRPQNRRFEGTLGVLTDITELKKAREQNLLLETSKALSRTLKLDQVLKIATKKMAQALKADRCTVAFTDPNMHVVTVKYIYLEDGSSSSAHLDVTIPTHHFTEAKESLKTKGHYQILNTRTDPIRESLRKYLLRVRVKSCLIIPMFIGKKLLGLFNIGSVKKLRDFTKEEIRLAQTIANQVAVAMENSLLLKDIKGKHDQIVKQTKVLERQYQEQRILMKISRELSKTLDLDRILQIGTQEAAQALRVDRCAVALAFPEKGYAEIRSIYVKGKKSVTHLVGYKLYGHQFPQAKEMLEKRKLINIPNIYHLPGKSFAKKYFIKQGIKSALFAPMVHGKKVMGFFVLSTMKDFKTFTRNETKLAQTIADQTAVAIENARLLELVRKSEENLRALNVQLVNVQEDERKKLAQELHDDVSQTLFAMKMNLDVTMKNLPTDLEKLEYTKNRLDDTEDLLSQTIDRIRNLTTDLRPSMLDDFGLTPALTWYIDNFSKRTDIKVYLTTKNFKGRLSSEIETTLYRIIQEALINVAKHAKATEVWILLSRKNSTVSLSLQDNGIGFDTKKITFPKDRLGLFSIKERVRLLNGEFDIRSKANKGTKLSVRIPLVKRRV